MASSCLHWCPPILTAPEAFKESLDCRYTEYLSDDWCIFHGLCRNGKELPKEVDHSVRLRDHPKDGPAHQDQKYAPEKGDDPPHAVRSRKEAHGAGEANRHGQTSEKENVPQRQHGGIKKEDDPKEQKDAS